MQKMGMDIQVIRAGNANVFFSPVFREILAGISGGSTYGFYGLISVLSALFVWKMIPETKGKSLDEMENICK